MGGGSFKELLRVLYTFCNDMLEDDRELELRKETDNHGMLQGSCRESHERLQRFK